MKIEAKNVAELGALSGPDMGLVDAIATDPTSASSFLGGNLESNLKGLDDWGESSVRAGSKTYGIRKAGGGPQPNVAPSSPGQAPKKGTVIFNDKTGKYERV